MTWWGGSKGDRDTCPPAIIVSLETSYQTLITLPGGQRLLNKVQLTFHIVHTHKLFPPPHNGQVSAHTELWESIKNEDLSKLYSDLIPIPRSVWQLISPVNDQLGVYGKYLLSTTVSRQEEKVYDFLRRFVLSTICAVAKFVRITACINKDQAESRDYLSDQPTSLRNKKSWRGISAWDEQQRHLSIHSQTCTGLVRKVETSAWIPLFIPHDPIIKAAEGGSTNHAELLLGS